MASECPYQQQQQQQQQVEVDPRSNMPTDLNISDEGIAKLSDARTQSSIPRSIPDANNEYWTYPSPRMFYNALHRKGKPIPSKDIPTVLQIHNFLNERVWYEIINKWEAMHANECTKKRKLVRFVGKPGTLSPKARLLGWWSGVRPFDRHDWVIDRCGRQVRYVIDYYGEEEDGNNANVRIGEDAAVFFVDIRPALDSFGAYWDRCRAAWIDFCNPAPPSK